jgi:hypothetical protein
MFISLKHQPMANTVFHTHCGQRILKMEAVRSSKYWRPPTPLCGVPTETTATGLTLCWKPIIYAVLCSPCISVSPINSLYDSPHATPAIIYIVQTSNMPTDFRLYVSVAVHITKKETGLNDIELRAFSTTTKPWKIKPPVNLLGDMKYEVFCG